MSDIPKFPRVVSALLSQPWALLPDKLAALADIIAARAGGHLLSTDEIRARLGGDPPAAPAATTVNGVAVLPVFGVIAPRANLFTMASGGTSAESIMRAIRAAVADPKVQAIVLPIDSPGGSVYLIPETAAAIRAARRVKPVTAVVSPLCASAGYWLAASASEIVATASADVGSIGVVTVHESFQQALVKDGVEITMISAGKYKTENNPYQALTADGRAALQHRVDAAFDRFIADVAAGRRVSERTVRDGFGQGRLLNAQDALAAGMIDRIGTLDDTLLQIQQTPAAATNSRHLSAGGTDQRWRWEIERQLLNL